MRLLALRNGFVGHVVCALVIQNCRVAPVACNRRCVALLLLGTTGLPVRNRDRLSLRVRNGTGYPTAIASLGADLASESRSRFARAGPWHPNHQEWHYNCDAHT